MPFNNVQNNFSTSLSAGITNSQTTLTLSATPSVFTPYYLSIGNDILNSPSQAEIVLVTVNNSGILTVTRGAQNTTPQSFSSGTKVQMLVTASHFNEIYFGINSSQMFPQNNVLSLDTLTVGNITMTLTPILLGSGTITLA